MDRFFFGLAGIFSLVSLGLSFLLFQGAVRWFMGSGFAVSAMLSFLLFNRGTSILWKKAFVLFSCLYPLGVNLGLVANFAPERTTLFSAFAFFGLLFILLAHTYSKDWGSFAVALVHAGAGMSIFILPVVMVGRGTAGRGFLWFSAGAVFLAAMGFGLLYFFSVSEEKRKEIFLKVVSLALFLGSFFFSLGLYLLKIG